MLSMRASILLGGLYMLLGAATTASAQELSHPELSHADMVCALDPDCASPFLRRRLRGVTATASEQPPLSFDVTVNFAYDSAELTPDSRAKLERVAKALTDPTTNKFDIVINGHTDARGTADYNQSLSERRAEAVRRHLVAQHGIDPSRLVAKGYGKSQLLLPSEPNNDLNRRVQFQNPNTARSASSAITPASTASRPVVAPVGTPSRTAAEGEGL